MGRLTGFWLHRFVNWDRPSQVGFLLAIGLCIVAIIVGVKGPESLRGPVLFGAVGLVIAAQTIFLWANRSMVTEYTKAQRLYLKGEFTTSVIILEELRGNNQADLRALTLLGNAYRQLGQLEDSETTLLQALVIDTEHPFPLYGLGRTRLAQGQYEEAAETIEKALANGAAEVCAFDAGEAHYRNGNIEQAIELLEKSRPYIQKEPHRVLMATYLLHKLTDTDPPSEKLVKAGITYWKTQAKIFAHTPYGSTLTEDIAAMQ
jgi:tetratricopeptide (TPR) repeat protein